MGGERGEQASWDALALRVARLGMFRFDPVSRETQWDAGLAALFGYDGDAPPALEARHVHPEDQPGLWDALTQAVRRRARFEYEYRITRRDGEQRWIHTYGEPVVRDGRLLIIGVGQDVTERRLGEQQREAALAAEQEARSAAGLSQRRLHLLARVAALLDAPMDLQATLQQVAELAVGELADWCAVDLEPTGPGLDAAMDGGQDAGMDGGPDGGLDAGLDGGTATAGGTDVAPSDHAPPAGADGPLPGRPEPADEPWQVAVVHRDPAMAALARELQEHYPPSGEDDLRRRVLDELVPVHLPVVDEQVLDALARDAQHRELLGRVGASSAVVVPLQSGGRAFGVLTLVATGGRRFDRADVELAVELGRRAGSAVDKARLHATTERAARARAASELRYRSLVESVTVGVWRADAEGLIVGEIAGWPELTGNRETAGWGWLEDVHPADREWLARTWQHSVRTGEHYHVTHRLRNAEGGWRWVDVHGTPLRADPADPASPVTEWFGWIIDVTDTVLRRERSEALRVCAESLSRAQGVADVVAALHTVGASALGASGVVVALEQRGALVVHQRGYTDLPEESAEAADLAQASAWPVLREVLRTGEPRFLDARGDLLDRLSGEDSAGQQLSATTARGEVCWAFLPLVQEDTILGAVRLGWREPQVFDDADAALLAAIAAQHAAALSRARTADIQRDTSLTLQAALAPVVPRQLGGVDIGMHYRAAGVHAQVGGDWADAFLLADGRVCLAVGDVMGSGITAAATMGRLRTALAALARHVEDPAVLLGDLDQMLLATPGDPLATLILAALDPVSRCACLYSAGHLPALVVPWDGQVRLVAPVQVPPLGVGWSSALVAQPTPVRLDDGAVLALCTDGLVERRGADIDHRLGEFADLLRAQCPLGDLDEEAERIVDLGAGRSRDDDVTLLLARMN